MIIWMPLFTCLMQSRALILFREANGRRSDCYAVLALFVIFHIIIFDIGSVLSTITHILTPVRLVYIGSVMN